MSATDWAREGGQAALYDGGLAIPYAVSRRIVKITATQIVLDDGKRYRRSDGRRVGVDYSPELLPVDDPRVLAVRARKISSELVGDAYTRTSRSESYLRMTAPEIRGWLEDLASRAHAAMREIDSWTED
jgi:hypothetical protein